MHSIHRSNFPFFFQVFELSDIQRYSIIYTALQFIYKLDHPQQYNKINILIILNPSIQLKLKEETKKHNIRTHCVSVMTGKYTHIWVTPCNL